MTREEHPDLDTLAAYTGGFLDRRQASVRSHLADCPACRRRAERLADVGRVLAEASPPPMPADVTARIDDALAAEESARKVAMPPPRQRGVLWLSGVAASVAVAVLGGVLGIRAATPDDGGEGAEQPRIAAGDGAARTAEREATPSRRHLMGSPGGSGSARAPGVAEAASALTVSGREYSPNRLPRQVSALLRHEAADPGAAARTLRPTPARLRPLAEPTALAACVSRVAGPGSHELLAADLSSYSGKPSAVIVAAAERAPGAHVWVVDPSCSHVRAHTELPRRGE